MMDWRKQIRSNERRTQWVMSCFLLIYVALGLLIDLNFQPEVVNLPWQDAVYQLLTFQVTPTVTIILGLIATIIIWLTFRYHDRIMLSGLKATEVTAMSQDFNEQQLYHIVEELTVAAGLRYIPKVYLIAAEYPNAFASGYSEKSALIAVTTGLMAKLNREELQAVVAHELSHIRHQDIKLTLMASVLANVIIMVIDMLFRGILWGESGRTQRERKNSGGNAPLIIIVLLLRIVLPLITMLLLLFLSRKREFMADAGAVELTRNSEPLAQALIKIHDDYEVHRQDAEYSRVTNDDVRAAAYIVTPIATGWSWRELFSTHPSLRARLRALRGE